jgi:uncharacterized protein YjbI with pentapeptide repeats
MAGHNVDWKPCDNDCAGVRLPTGQKCWAHADDADLDAALKRFGEDGHLDARGVPITQELLKRLLAAAPHDDRGRPILTNARFNKATFRGPARFVEVTFEGTAHFDEATFQKGAAFVSAKFQSDASFATATFGVSGELRLRMFGRGRADFTTRTFGVSANFDGATFWKMAFFGEARFNGHADFTVAEFHGSTIFVKTAFQGDAHFDEAAFQKGTRFDEAMFHGDAFFGEAWFRSSAGFHRATFQRRAIFGETTFRAYAHFGEATFQGSAGFDRATFPVARFTGATFQDDALFGGATFRWGALFNETTFQGDAVFGEAWFRGDARFYGATFHRAQLGPMLVRRGLVLDQAVFHEPAQIEVSAAAVCCRRTRFLAGVQLRVRWAQVVLDEAVLSAPSILTGASESGRVEEGRWAYQMEQLARRRDVNILAGRPRLTSVRHADVAQLTLAGVDLRACRFAGAHHLDQLHIEESDFARTPKGWRWTTRQTIAEEHHWRRGGPRQSATSRKGLIPAWRAVWRRKAHRHVDWYRPACRPPPWLDTPPSADQPSERVGDVQPPTPAQIAAIYRALRKGREDNKDEPGAADFYYGEMEMRRHDPTKPRAERLVLFLYWLFSGYALRASRALAWLLGVLAVASLLLAAVGFQQSPAGWSFPARLGTAVLVALEGALFRASEQQLAYLGRLIQIALRFAGPVLLGLAVLSIRGRVKR